MAGEWACRECGAQAKAGAYLILPRPLNGRRAVCVPCVDRYMSKYRVERLGGFVTCYTKEQQELTPLKALQQEVRELRALLADVTDPNK